MAPWHLDDFWNEIYLVEIKRNNLNDLVITTNERINVLMRTDRFAEEEIHKYTTTLCFLTSDDSKDI